MKSFPYNCLSGRVGTGGGGTSSSSVEVSEGSKGLFESFIVAAALRFVVETKMRVSKTVAVISRKSIELHQFIRSSITRDRIPIRYPVILERIK